MDDTGSAQADRAYVEAMRAEVNWAPLRFDGWGHYEQARPTMPGEVIEVIGRWPDEGYLLQYRPLLSELTEARQYPIDPIPTVTVLGRADESDLADLRAFAANGKADEVANRAVQIARSDRTIPNEPPVRTGSTIPDHAEVPVQYEPVAGLWLGSGRLVDDDHPCVAYALAGQLRLRLGPPVGITPTGLLVFQPVGTERHRITLEHPSGHHARMAKASIGVYRLDGLGAWRQIATVHAPEGLALMLVRSRGAAHDATVPILVASQTR